MGGYRYTFKNNEEVEQGHVAFKQNLLWDVIRFLMKSLPDKRLISIDIRKSD